VVFDTFASMLSIFPEYWIPVFIFIARVVDVSMGTLRIIFVSRGMRMRAALLGFVEVLLWIIIVAQIFQNLDNWVNYIAYAGGFSVGTFLGITFERKLKVGTVIIRVITNDDASGLVSRLENAGFMITRVEAEGGKGPVEIIFTIIKRKRWNEAVEIIESFDQEAFYSVEDVKYSSAEESDKIPLPISRSAFDRLLRIRKGI